ncbi:hypothetical protein Droror1_Dr00012191 [Drosera rotundifolia]
MADDLHEASHDFMILDPASEVEEEEELDKKANREEEIPSYLEGHPALLGEDPEFEELEQLDIDDWDAIVERLTFDAGKMKVDEDPFPKAANVNMEVITLLDGGVRDESRFEGQKLTEEKMRSLQRQNERRPEVFAQILEPTENLCVCWQGDIALVRQMSEELNKNSAGPSSTVHEVLSGSLPIGPMEGRTFRPRVGRIGEWGVFVPKRRKSVPFKQLTRTQQRRAQRKYGQRI